MLFELLQVAIGNRAALSRTPSADEWADLLHTSRKQTLSGIAFAGVQRLAKEQQPPRHLLMQWYMEATRIQERNRQMTRRSQAVADKFRSEGFPCLILKGQSLTPLYVTDHEPGGIPLGEYRTPGDIDIWLLGRRSDIINYIRGLGINSTPTYHHIDFPISADTPIEVHFTPSWMNSPITNRRLQRFFKVNGQRTTDNGQQTTDNGQRTTDNGQQTTDTGHRTTDNRQRTTDNGQRTRFVQANESQVHLNSCSANAKGALVATKRTLVLPRRSNLLLFSRSSVTESLTGVISDDVNDNQQSVTAINQRPEGAINRAEHFNRSEASLTVTEGYFNRAEGALTSTEGAYSTHNTLHTTQDQNFNRVFILVHIYRHLFHEGIGLRQLMDYYFVLHQGFTEEEREETMHTLRALRMKRFAAAVMWVLQEVFAMDDRYLLIEPDEREGRFLLDEIMQAGNFGHYDERIKRSAEVTEWQLFRRRVTRNLRFLRSYPSEVLWSPLFKIWHYFWRKRQ